MKTETVRRCFNLNSFESLTLEGEGRDENPRKALLLAERDCLVKAQASMIRIFNNRQQHQIGNEFDGTTYAVVTKEIDCIEQELTNCN